ncbi:MAG: hypothetical protein ACTHM6_05945 [Tepidisphaeraceae bacterium]
MPADTLEATELSHPRLAALDGASRQMPPHPDRRYFSSAFIFPGIEPDLPSRQVVLCYFVLHRRLKSLKMLPSCGGYVSLSGDAKPDNGSYPPIMILAQAQQQVPLLDVFLPMLPWAIIFVFFWVFCYRRLRGERIKVEDTNARAKEHWAAVEAKLDRVIELLEDRSRGG